MYFNDQKEAYLLDDDGLVVTQGAFQRGVYTTKLLKGLCDPDIRDSKCTTYSLSHAHLVPHELQYMVLDHLPVLCDMASLLCCWGCTIWSMLSCKDMCKRAISH